MDVTALHATRRRRGRWLGAVAGAALPLALAAAVFAAGSGGELALGGPADAWGFVGFISVYGIPVGAILGWIAGPHVAGTASWRGVAGRALAVALGAVVLGAFEVGAVLALEALVSGSSSDPVTSVIAGLTLVPLLGIVVLGVPALAAVAPITLLWAVLVRVLATRRPARG